MARRVLVVDDEVPLGEYLADALHGVGYEVEVVGTAIAGITAARARRPDVILLDLGLPGGLSGEQAMPELLRFAPVIIITGRQDDDLARRLIADGASAYVRKPFALSALLNMVKAAAGG